MRKNGRRLSLTASNKKTKHSKEKNFQACSLSGSFFALGLTPDLTTLWGVIGSRLANLATCNFCCYPGKLAIPTVATCKKSRYGM